MRTPLIALAVALIGIFLWSTVAWVPADGVLHAWNPSTGRLTVPTRGVSFLARWSHQRQVAAPLEAEIQTTAKEGSRVGIRLRWEPAPGTYSLAAAEAAPAGLTDRAAEPVEAIVEATAFACFVPEVSTEGAGNDCPPDLSQRIAEAVATTIGTVAGHLEVTVQADPGALRELLLAAIAEDLDAEAEAEAPKVLVLGLDGLDWKLVRPWVRAGQMPNLARLMEAGTWGDMETLVPTLSPLIWTTMATGVAPDRHGILDFVEKEPQRGLLLPITGRGRLVPAVWNLASALGRTVGVVGWWATWPAERVRGVMISDRLYYTLTQGISEAVLRQDPPELIFPQERLEEFTELRDRATQETDWQAVRFFMDIPEAQFASAVAANLGMEDPVDGFRRILAASRTYLGAGLRLASEQPDLLMVYLEGTDTLGHLLAPYMPPPTLDVDPVQAATYVAAVPKYFRVVDRWIGRYLEHYPLSESAILVVSDHGFKWSEGRPTGLSGTAGPTAPLWHENEAVFVAAGRGVKRLGRVDLATTPASVYDVAPSVMALLGLPLGAGWRGSTLPGVDESTHQPIDYLPLVPPAAYRQQIGSEDLPVDPEFIAKLQSLGYLGGGASAGGTVTPEALPTGATEPPQVDTSTATRGQLNNLAVVKINQKDYAEGERLLRQAIELSPSYPSPHYNLRRIYMETKRYDDADRELWLAVSKGLRDAERTIDRAAKDYDNLDLQERTVTLLTEAIEHFPDHEPFWVHLLVARIRLDQCAEGLDIGRQAVVKFPNSAPAHAFYGLTAGCLGDVPTARAELERSLELNPNQASLRRTLDGLPPG
ncbi:MAG: alkaline phosphatase family protein [Acidobacteriota bacterium]